MQCKMVDHRAIELGEFAGHAVGGGIDACINRRQSSFDGLAIVQPTTKAYRQRLGLFGGLEVQWKLQPFNRDHPLNPVRIDRRKPKRDIAAQ